MTAAPVHVWTLLDAARAVRDGEISSRDLTRALLDRIERLDPKVNSYITVTVVFSSGTGVSQSISFGP